MMKFLAVIFLFLIVMVTISGATVVGYLLRPKSWNNSPNDILNWMDVFLENKGPVTMIVTVVAGFLTTLVAVFLAFTVLL